jgi:hypothetical protein
MVTYQLPIDPFSVDFPEFTKGERIFKTNSEAMRIEEALKYFHNSRGVIENPSRVRQYLYRYPDMTGLLICVVGLINARFDFNTKLYLNIYQDQETRYEDLILYIRQRVYDANIMKMIKNIRREYRRLFPRTRGRFLLTTDFRLLR